jgi:hypothetical protein
MSSVVFNKFNLLNTVKAVFYQKIKSIFITLTIY